MPPQSKGISSTSLDWRCSKDALGSAFVRRSAAWSSDHTNHTSRIFAATLSRMKWKFMAKCLDLKCKVGFLDNATAPLLSHRTVIGPECECPNSSRIILIHSNSAVVLATLRYSDSIVDLDSVGFFFELHETRLEPRKIKYAPWFFLSWPSPLPNRIGICQEWQWRWWSEMNTIE